MYQSDINRRGEDMSKKELHEEFTKFFENPTRETFSKLIKNSVGEMDHIDFKESLPEMHKLAKHFLSFANHGGGAIVVGIKEGDSLEAVGIENILDKADIAKGVKKYIPNSLKHTVLDFSYSTADYAELNGKTFQVIIIESREHELPYICKKSGTGLKEGSIYVRNGTSSCEATHDEVQEIISKRIDTQYSTTGDIDLDEHLNQLKSLYKQLPEGKSAVQKLVEQLSYGGLGIAGAGITASALVSGMTQTPEIESYDDFIKDTIARKKNKIRQFLDLDT